MSSSLIGHGHTIHLIIHLIYLKENIRFFPYESIYFEFRLPVEGWINENIHAQRTKQYQNEEK